MSHRTLIVGWVERENGFQYIILNGEIIQTTIIQRQRSLTLVLIFLALSAYKRVLRVSSNEPLAGLAWAIITVLQLPPKESYATTKADIRIHVEKIVKALYPTWEPVHRLIDY